MLKNSDTRGKVYSTLPLKKDFELATFLKENGLEFKNTLFQFDFGKPDTVETDQASGVMIERFKNRTGGLEGIDSIYRYYDKRLSSIKFSFNPGLDRKTGSKFSKMGFITKGNVRDTNGVDVKSRREEYWSIQKPSLTPIDERVLMDVFSKFIAEEGKKK